MVTNLLSFSAQAQNKKEITKSNSFHQRWELGLLGGATQYQGDMNELGMKEINGGLGLMLRYHRTDNVALRLNFLAGGLSGNDLNSSTNAARNLSFNAIARELSVLGEFDLRGKRRFANDFQKTFSPYIFGGVALSSVLPDTYYFKGAGTNADAYAADKNQSKQPAFLTIPLGLGFKYDLSRLWTINVEAGYRLAFNDYLDGVSQLGNPNDKDGYAFAGVGVGYRIVLSDTDGDGIRDILDHCPTEKGSKNMMGCPDYDRDGVIDAKDNCPEEKGKASSFGCPDKDSDGIADADDKCPELAGTFNGCPDTDGDGVHDGIDICPSEKGNLTDKGCPMLDADNDGVTDAKDKCPNLKGTDENNGCPVDSDKDGIFDSEDKCPTLAGKLLGCPDTDSDGVADADDKCPNIAGVPAQMGCPTVSDADRRALEQAIYGVQFETGKATFRGVSYPILDNVADIMLRNSMYNLRIMGHTDNVGGDKANLDLSENRARACYSYLISKGIDAKRMSYSGVGKNQPVAENTTAEGRAKNRRVAFELQLN